MSVLVTHNSMGAVCVYIKELISLSHHKIIPEL